MRRVVVTGVGVISPLGNDPATLFSSLMAGKSGIREIATEIGRSEGAVKQLQFRGLQNLRSHVEKQPGGKNG